MTMTTTAIKILDTTDTHIRVGGYGVVFGGADLEGETFTPSTDFMLGMVPQPPVFYDHTLRDVKHSLGRVTKTEPDDTGLWVEAELDRHAAYMQHIITLAEKGVLGWSSGSVSHLTRREGKSITVWPLVEMSLTPTPAEPRTLGVDVLKSLAQLDDSFEALLPEDARPASAQDADETKDAPPVIPIVEPMEDTVNEEQTQVEPQTETQTPDIKTMVAELVAKALADMPATNDPGVADKSISLNTKTRLGDSEVKALAYYLRTGDQSAVKASNNTDMNIGTSADGGFAVPTGHYQGIIAKRDATMLAPKLGVMRIPGKGTTVNVPYDNGTANAFVSTAEATNFDRDAPVLAQKAFTLVKYTKKIQLSYELLQDEDSRIMAFLDDYVGRALALTHNTLLITEALASGTSVALSSVTAAAAGDPQTLVYTLKQAYTSGAQFVMKGATFAALMKLTGDGFQYAETPGGGRGYALWGYPVQRDENLEAIGSGKKTILFGDFSYMGLYEAPSMTFLRDPYSSADTGQVNLFYYFRADYGVLLPEAILYGQHPTG